MSSQVAATGKVAGLPCRIHRSLSDSKARQDLSRVTVLLEALVYLHGVPVVLSLRGDQGQCLHMTSRKKETFNRVSETDHKSAL